MNENPVNKGPKYNPRQYPKGWEKYENYLQNKEYLEYMAKEMQSSQHIATEKIKEALGTLSSKLKNQNSSHENTNSPTSYLQDSLISQLLFEQQLTNAILIHSLLKDHDHKESLTAYFSKYLSGFMKSLTPKKAKEVSKALLSPFVKWSQSLKK